jgi:hypothetical protein
MQKKAKTPPAQSPARGPQRPTVPQQAQRVQRPAPPRRAPQRHQGR